MLQTIKFDKVLFGAVGDEIAKKVRASHAPSVMGRGFAEHVHGYQLVEALLPLCEKHGLVLMLSDGEDKYTISTPADIIPVMNRCDEEYLCITDGEVNEEGEGETTYVSVLLIYGNNADDPETGRGEMVADWSGCTDWYDIFDPVLDAFIDNREVEEEEVTV
jgi:hypothetical protein